MSQLQYMHNYPSANVKVDVSGGELSIGDIKVTTNDNPLRLHDRFLLMDDLENWRSIPLLIESNGVETYDVFMPYTESVNVANWHLFRRRLYLNTKNSEYGPESGKKRFIPVTRPSAKHKALLHAITYAAYDYNEMLYMISVPDIATRLVPNKFMTGVHGIKLNSTPIELGAVNILPRSRAITTAHYPVYFDEVGRREMEFAVMQSLQQGAPRSSVRGGMLPGDFYQNNFWCHIRGYEGTPAFANPIGSYTNIWETPSDNQSYGADVNPSTSGKTDMILPGVTNEIDILIPDDVNWLDVHVGGPGWRHGAFEINTDAYPNSPNRDVYKGLGGAGIPYFTYIQMPVKVQIDIRYWEEPPEPVEEGGGE